MALQEKRCEKKWFGPGMTVFSQNRRENIRNLHNTAEFLLEKRETAPDVIKVLPPGQDDLS